MFILFGRWHVGRKAVAYRADWCTVCERRIVARGDPKVQDRQFENVFVFIPVNPRASPAKKAFSAGGRPG